MTTTFSLNHSEEPPPPPPAELEEPSDLEEIDVPWSDAAYWDVFIPDDDQYDPLPEPGDFWIEDPEELKTDDHRPEFSAPAPVGWVDDGHHPGTDAKHWSAMVGKDPPSPSL